MCTVLVVSEAYERHEAMNRCSTNGAPIFVPFESVQYKWSANICTFRIDAVQTERHRIFVQLKFAWETIKTYIECATGNIH